MKRDRCASVTTIPGGGVVPLDVNWKQVEPMKLTHAALVFAFVATQAVAEDRRIRIENTGATGRVEIVVSDERVQTVEISVPNGTAGELVTVEAPARQVRLGGGSIDGDPLLEAMVQQKLRTSSARASTVTVLPAPPRFRAESDSRCCFNRSFTDVGFVLSPVWGVSDRHPHTRQKTAIRRDRHTGSQPGARSASAPRPPRPSHTKRGMMPRY